MPVDKFFLCLHCKLLRDQKQKIFLRMLQCLFNNVAVKPCGLAASGISGNKL